MALVADKSVVLAYDASYLELAIRLAVPLATHTCRWPRVLAGCLRKRATMRH